MRNWRVITAGIALAVLAGAQAPAPPARIHFLERAKAAGLTFVLENSASPDKNMIETMAGGAAAFDFNGDGRPDIFFTNGAAIPSLEKDAPKYANRLFRNDGDWQFTDVTSEAGVAGAGYSIGAAAADYDNDGHVDLFVAGVNRNILYHNLGNGKFEDVTAKAGIKSAGWAVAGSWFDYDNDGLLDLFVVNYLQWSPATNRFCGDRGLGIRTYCHPKYYEGLPNTLYHNLGNGRFEDVSKKSGIAGHIGKGMSAAVADYDGDGFMDVFVTNDKVPNFLFHNLGNGRFEEAGLTAGVALADHGLAISSMGAEFRDYNNDGMPDASVVALAGESFPLFRNLGKGLFKDATVESRLAPLVAGRSGWSQGLFDLNNDGWKDLFVSGSHVNDLIDRFEASHYREPNMVFAGSRAGFTNATGDEFKTFARPHRGAVFADFNGDGRLDVAVSVLGEQAELWENVSPPKNWIAFRLRGTRSNRDGIGAVIKIGSQTNHCTTSVGYGSSSDPAVHFGLGAADKAERVEIRWPSGTVQVLENVKANQALTVVEPNAK